MSSLTAEQKAIFEMFGIDDETISKIVTSIKTTKQKVSVTKKETGPRRIQTTITVHCELCGSVTTEEVTMLAHNPNDSFPTHFEQIRSKCQHCKEYLQSWSKEDLIEAFLTEIKPSLEPLRRK